MMKKALLLLLCAALALGATACTNNDNQTNDNPSTDDTQSTTQEQEEGEAPDLPMTEIPLDGSGERPAGEEQVPFSFEPAASFSAEDAYMTVTLELEQESYTLNEVIPLYITLTNHSDSNISFVHGSGSSKVPDALKLEFGGLAPLFYPDIMTMDYRLTSLEPGQSLYFECSFAPYLAGDENARFGTDKDIEFFQEGEYTPATPGETLGTVALTYSVMEDQDDETLLFMGFDDAESHTISTEFSVAITAGE